MQKPRTKLPKIEFKDEEIAFGNVTAEMKQPPADLNRNKGPRTTVCPICGKLLKGDFGKVYKKHLSLVHKQEKKFHCQFCEEVFKYRTSLYVHQSKAHGFGCE